MHSWEDYRRQTELQGTRLFQGRLLLERQSLIIINLLWFSLCPEYAIEVVRGMKVSDALKRMEITLRKRRSKLRQVNDEQITWKYDQGFISVFLSLKEKEKCSLLSCRSIASWCSLEVTMHDTSCTSCIFKSRTGNRRSYMMTDMKICIRDVHSFRSYYNVHVTRLAWQENDTKKCRSKRVTVMTSDETRVSCWEENGMECRGPRTSSKTFIPI